MLLCFTSICADIFTGDNVCAKHYILAQFCCHKTCVQIIFENDRYRMCSFSVFRVCVCIFVGKKSCWYYVGEIASRKQTRAKEAMVRKRVVNFGQKYLCRSEWIKIWPQELVFLPTKRKPYFGLVWIIDHNIVFPLLFFYLFFVESKNMFKKRTPIAVKPQNVSSHSIEVHVDAVVFLLYNTSCCIVLCDI